MDQEYEEYEAECFQSTRVSGQAGKDAQRLLDRDSGRQLTRAAVATVGGSGWNY